MLYAQNGDRIVATDSVTSLDPIYFYNNKLARMHGTVKLTKRHAKPVGIASRLKIRTYNVVLGSSPGYPPSRLLMIVNWSVIFLPAQHLHFLSYTAICQMSHERNYLVCVHKLRCHGNVPYGNKKLTSGQSINPRNAAKIGPIDVEIIGLTEIVNLRNK